MFKNSLMLMALALTGVVAVWGIVDTPGLANFASSMTGVEFTTRTWFIMLTVSALLITCIWLALSPYGKIKLGQEEDEPEFSTVSWLTMLFAAGMGVGILFFGTAEPMSHYGAAREYLNMSEAEAAGKALFITNFHWGFHAWAIYGIVGLCIGYFSYRRECPTLISSPIQNVFGRRGWTRGVGWCTDLLAIYATAIGMGGAIALGVFQIQSGIEALVKPDLGASLTLGIFVVVCLGYALPLTVDLSKGLAVLSNIALAIAGGLMVFVLLTGPTHYLMSGIVGAMGDYFAGFFPQGFRTFTFFDSKMTDWFQGWTLTYMVWWLAWAPFVGVFIARISKGRTIREYIVGVVVVPTLFSIFWFGVFGSVGFYGELVASVEVLELVKTDINRTLFFVLEHLPMPLLTISAIIVASFLFVVTSVVSAAFVLSMFSTNGDQNPLTGTKVIWGVILAALGLVMILSNSVDAVKTIIALSAMPFVFIVLFITMCLLKALEAEEV